MEEELPGGSGITPLPDLRICPDRAKRAGRRFEHAGHNFDCGFVEGTLASS